MSKCNCMNRQNTILAILSAGESLSYTPVQVQKLFFLVDKNISDHDYLSLYNFQPYNYGPFDVEVYRDLERLSEQGLATVSMTGRWRMYSLTQEGYKMGRRGLDSLDEGVKQYLQELAKFVQSLSFADLVSAVYKAYPEMRANSVFQDKP